MNFKLFCQHIVPLNLPKTKLIPLINTLKIQKATWDKQFKGNPKMLNLGWPLMWGPEWTELLSKQPQFAKHCDWNKLHPRHWSILLQNQPQFADKCDLNKFDGWEWSDVICYVINHNYLNIVIGINLVVIIGVIC